MLKKMVLGVMQVNCYIVYNENNDCLIIDPGAQGRKIAQFIEENNLNVRGILLTHGHFDHIGAIDYLYPLFHCPIYTHQETIELLHDSRLNLSEHDIPLVIDKPITPVQKVMDIAGFHIQWLLLEGHCQGSSMIYFPNENLLFSGDVLFKGSIGRYDFLSSSHFLTKQSLKTIQSFDFDARLLPGHGDESTLSQEKQNNPFLRS
jgi:hydroxyacylglutathione hydrolase